jgi:hypothetical protein
MAVNLMISMLFQMTKCFWYMPIYTFRGILFGPLSFCSEAKCILISHSYLKHLYKLLTLIFLQFFFAYKYQAFSEKGYVKRMKPNTFNLQNRGTIGKSVGKLRVNDAMSDFIVCHAHDHVLYFRFLSLSLSPPA